MSDVIFKNEQKSSSVVGGKFMIGAMYAENFGDLYKFIKDPDVTDINWNGRALWVDDITKGRYLADVVLTKDFIDAFCVRVANVVSRTFNKYYPRLEAETDELRITIVHHNSANTGTAISIRKTPATKRISFAKSVKDYFRGDEYGDVLANFLSNCVKAHMNIVVGGLPGVGKTELVKYLTSYIFPRDRVITIEDTMELHYSKINPTKDCVELKVDDKVFTYTDAIKTCLRLLPQWILLSEARSKEVQYLLESISTGAKCITTIHTDDMRKVPKRVINMMGDMDNSDLAESMAYTYFDVGILVDKDQDVSTGQINRYIAQIVLYGEDKDGYHCYTVYDRGKFDKDCIPEEMMMQFRRYGIVRKNIKIGEPRRVDEFDPQAQEVCPFDYVWVEDINVVPEDNPTGFLDSDEEAQYSEVNTTGVTGNATSRYTDDEAEASGELETETSEEVNQFLNDLHRARTPENGAIESEERLNKMLQDLEEKGTGSMDANSEEATGYMGDSEDCEENATGTMDDAEESATGYMGSEDSEEDGATGYMKPEDDIESGSTGALEKPEGGTGDIEEGATGVMEDEGTGDMEGAEPSEISEEDEDGATGVMDDDPKGGRKRGKRGRRY